MGVLGDRLGIYQTKIFRGPTEEAVMGLFNDFNKEHKNIEFISFMMDSDLVGEFDMEQLVEKTTRNRLFVYGDVVGTYIYFEYEDSGAKELKF